jgi:hypothetical protein
LNKAIESTNGYYGKTGIATAASRVIFINGSIDPWHALGLTPNSTNFEEVAASNNTVIFIKGKLNYEFLI